MSNKHAYLIMAHNQPELLCELLRALDYPDNDIYLHVDLKMKLCPDLWHQQVRQGRLIILSERMVVNWGGFSMIQCELLLLEEATKEFHAYYHLMSGVDLPLKSQKVIHQYFANHNGVEFVHFQNQQISKADKWRVAKYHLIIQRRENKKWHQKILGKLLMALQLGVDRTKNSGLVFQKGANWFSITHELAAYVVSRKAFVLQSFKHTLCADEMFLQTIVYNSEFRNKVVANNYCDNYANILYYIDWMRGCPYEFTSEDYGALMASDMLFARKFNWNKDSTVVRRIVDTVTSGE